MAGIKNQLSTKGSKNTKWVFGSIRLLDLFRAFRVFRGLV